MAVTPDCDYNKRTVFRVFYIVHRDGLQGLNMKKSSGIKMQPSAGPTWTFLSNHAHVLWCLYRTPDALLKDVALEVGITERMVQKIVGDLAAADYLTVEKVGRRNHYQLHTRRPLRHPLESHCAVGEILKLLKKQKR
jgi:hypothetical protein